MEYRLATGSTVSFAAANAAWGTADNRGYIRTIASDYHSVDFVMEGTVDIKNGSGPNGTAFMGIGTGSANSSNYSLPLDPSVFFEVAPNGFATGFVGMNDNASRVSGTLGQGAGWDGVHRLRLTWTASTRMALLQADKDYTGGAFTADYSYTINGSDNGFDATNSRLFFGGGEGVVWDDISVVLPGIQILNANPPHQALAVPVDVALTWTAPAGVGSPTYNVYIGTNPTLSGAEQSLGQSGLSHDPLGAGNLAYDTVYYWRVDVVDSGTVHPGTVRSFTTAPAPGVSPKYFSDNFSGTGFSANWEPVGGGVPISLTSGKAKFSGVGDSGRAYLRTALTDYASATFIAEVTVTVSGGGGSGSAFFGLGAGAANSGKYNEPATAPVIYARLTPSNFASGSLTLSSSTGDLGSLNPGPGDGTHRVRLIRHAEQPFVVCEVDANWTGGPFQADYQLIKTGVPESFTASTARIFFGGAGNVTFDDFVIAAADSQQVYNDYSSLLTQGSWLPVAGGPPSALPSALGNLLTPLNGWARPLVCGYQGSKFTQYQAIQLTDAGNGTASGQLNASGNQWNCVLSTQAVAGAPDAVDVDVSFQLNSGAVTSSGVAVAFDFTGWEKQNYVMLPASVYNANRCKIDARGYANGINRSFLYTKGLPLMANPLPQLSFETGDKSRIEVTTTNLATPAMCFYNHTTGKAFIVLAEQGMMRGGAMVNHGFVVEENQNRDKATFVVSAPGVREQKPTFTGFTTSSDRGLSFAAGDTVRLRLRIFAFDAAGIPGLLDRFMTVRKDVTGPNQPRNLVPFSKVKEYMTSRIDGRFTGYGGNNFYAPENASWISFGWVGGLMNTHPMLALGDATHLSRVTKTFDFALAGQDPVTGYYYSVLSSTGAISNRDGYPEYPKFVVTRKNCDVLFWMIKQFELLKAQGRGSAIKTAWENSARKVADALVATWAADGEWGNTLNAETGRVAVFNTTGGAQGVGALALASRYFNEPNYLQVAVAAANFYYQRDFLQTGQTTGGVGDTMQNADSESNYGFTQSMMALYEVTGDRAWLQKSRNLANLFATWTTSFDYVLPSGTELALNGAKLTGVVWANTQNKHGAPGECTSSCDALFKIYRDTGDVRYAELLRDIIGAYGEGIRSDGAINERLTYCDAEPGSVGNRGTHYTGWNETNGIMMAFEVPGIYVCTDADRFYVFDRVVASVLTRDAGGVTLSITNPTNHNAVVSVFGESDRNSRRALGYTSFLKWSPVNVAAGATVTVQVPHVEPLQSGVEIIDVNGESVHLSLQNVLPGQTYSLWRSTNMQNWNRVQDIGIPLPTPPIDPANPVDFPWSEAMPGDKGFYRLKW